MALDTNRTSASTTPACICASIAMRMRARKWHCGIMRAIKRIVKVKP